MNAGFSSPGNGSSRCRARGLAILLLVLPTAAFALSLPTDSRPLRQIERQVYLMGTRAVLVVYAPAREEGLEDLERFIGFLERTEQELSTWRRDSVLSNLNRHPLGVPFLLPPALCRLFAELQFWNRETRAAFDPAIGALVQAWKLHQRGNIPAAGILQEALGRAGMQHLNLSGCQVARLLDVRIDPGAFGKGEALDRVFHAAAPRNSGPWLIDFGGQVLVHGQPPGKEFWEIDLAHPLERNRPLLRLHLVSGSLATSGGSERDLQVGSARIGHILDPRTGFPAKYRGSVAVWHPSALVADILSTALYVMGPEDGLAWAEARDLAVCFMVVDDSELPDKQVSMHPSSAFARRFL